MTLATDERSPRGGGEGGTVRICGNGWERQFPWHDATRLGSAAFWVEETRKHPHAVTYRVGSTLLEEVAFCLLGGYGVNERMAFRAYEAVRGAGLLRAAGPVALHEFEDVLRRPISIPGKDHPIRYRFPHQRAGRLALAAEILATQQPPALSDARRFRDWLIAIPGIGPKTASWIVRNITRSDAIAVVDIHIRRAGVFAGAFDPAWRLPRDYRKFEEAFCTWAALGGVDTADMDATIWSALSALGNGARLIFGVPRLSDLDQTSRNGRSQGRG